MLPPHGHLHATSAADPLPYYYRFGLGLLLRQKLRWICEILPAGGCGTLLEIGYGSGIFLYELARHTRRLFSVDIHPNGADVRRRCAADGVAVAPVQGNGTALPFAEASFDIIVMNSVLEFMPDPAACLHEAFRVLRPGGYMLAVTPCAHRWTDVLWRMFAGIDPETEFRGGRQRVRRALDEAPMRVERYLRPWPLPRPIAPYELVVERRTAPARFAGLESV